MSQTNHQIIKFNFLHQKIEKIIMHKENFLSKQNIIMYINACIYFSTH